MQEKQNQNFSTQIKLFKKTRRLLADRKDMFENSEILDWAMAELLAYATLLDEGHDILTQVASYGSGSKTPTQFARNIAKLIDLK